MATALVLTVKVADFAPAAMVTLAGTDADPVALRLTVKPPVGAGPVILTVPVEELPLTTLVGLSVTLNGDGAFTATVVETDAPLAAAVSVATVLLDTGTPITVNATVVAPAATVTLAGVEIGPLLLKVTVSPPAGATLLMVSLPAVDPPGAMLVGLQVSSFEI